jgi:hypothetical protein
LEVHRNSNRNRNRNRNAKRQKKRSQEATANQLKHNSNHEHIDRTAQCSGKGSMWHLSSASFRTTVENLAKK